MLNRLKLIFCIYTESSEFKFPNLFTSNPFKYYLGRIKGQTFNIFNKISSRNLPQVSKEERKYIDDV